MAKEKIVLVGFGGHGRSVADCIERMGTYEIIGYTDMQKSSPDNGYCYLGKDEMLQEIFDSGVKNAFICVGQTAPDKIRHMLYEKVKDIGFSLPVICDPSSIISDSAVIEEGSFIGKGCIINVNSSIKKMCIINTGTIIEHDNVINEFTHIAVGCVLSGNVTVKENCFIGAGTTIIHGLTINKNALIGAGSTVIHNVSQSEKKYGIV